MHDRTSRTTARRLLSALLGLLSSTRLAGTARGATSADTAPDYWTISGRVTASSTQLPISGAVVNAYLTSSGFGHSVGSDSTDENGLYTIYGNETGEAVIVALAGPYFIGKEYDDTRCFGQISGGQGPFCEIAGHQIFIPVAPGANATGIDFALDPGGAVSGSVTAADTALPLSFVSVSFYTPDGTELGPVYADATGLYATSGFPPGSVVARTSNLEGYVDQLYDGKPCVYACDVSEGTPIAITAAEVHEGIDFLLARGGQIAGTITDRATGSPWPYDSGVFVYSSTGAFLTQGTSYDDGAYVTETGLTTGSYFVTAFGPYPLASQLHTGLICDPTCDVTLGTPVSVTQGLVTSGLDFQLEERAFFDGFEIGDLRNWSSHLP